MNTTPLFRVIGAGPLAERVKAACIDASFEEASGPRDEAVTLVVGTAPDIKDARPPVILVCEKMGPAELELLASAVVSDVLPEPWSCSLLLARIRRAWLRRDEQVADSWRREVEQLLGLIRDLATVPGGLPSVLHRLVLRLAEAAGVERCSLILLDESTPGYGTVVATSDQANVQDIHIALADYPEVREALRTGEPVVVADAAHHPLLDLVREQIERAGVGSVAVFPLREDAGVQGALLMRSHGQFERPDRLRLAATAAVATSIAVRHGRLVEQARGESARELARYSDLVEHISDGVAVVDRDGRIVLLNSAGATILGGGDDYIGRKFLDVAPPADAFAAQFLWREILKGGRVLNADLEVTRSTGARAVIALSAGQLKRQKLAVLSFRDVSEQRATENELRRTRDFLERVIDASGDAIIAADLRGRLLVYNRGAENIFGWSVKDARDSITTRDLYPEGGAREVMRLLRESPHGRVESVRIYGRTKKNETFPLELSAGLVRVGGKEVATVGLLRDLRERVRVEGELSKARSRLSEAEKRAAITALAGATAHELNQPLTVVLGHIELMRRRVTDERARASIDTITQEAERMASIVKKIAKLTRVETVSYPGERVIADIERSGEPQSGAPVVKD